MNSENAALQCVANTIQCCNLDILLLNKFDHVWSKDGIYDHEATLETVMGFKNDYLQVSQASGNDLVDFEYV
jgi:hypothetical protein